MICLPFENASQIKKTCARWHIRDGRDCVKRSAANLVIRHVGSYDVTVKPTVRNYSNSSRVEFIPRVDPPVNSEDLIRQIVHKVLMWHIILGTDIFVFF